MPKNNPTRDRYNPPQSVHPDFEPSRWSDINDGDIFHLEEAGDPYRKLSDTEAENTRRQTLHEVLSNIDNFIRL